MKMPSWKKANTPLNKAIRLADVKAAEKLLKKIRSNHKLRRTK